MLGSWWAWLLVACGWPGRVAAWGLLLLGPWWAWLPGVALGCWCVCWLCGLGVHLSRVPDALEVSPLFSGEMRWCSLQAPA